MVNHSTRRKLEVFAHLQDGWYYGTGKPPAASTLQRAEAILGMYEDIGLQETDAFCSQDGEVMVTAYFDNGYLECDINLDGSCWFQHEDGYKIIQQRLHATSETELTDFIRKAVQGRMS